MPRLRFCVLNIVRRQVELVVMPLYLTAVLGAAAGEHALHWQLLRGIERQNTSIDQVEP
jgi:hypothetical protein